MSNQCPISPSSWSRTAIIVLSADVVQAVNVGGESSGSLEDDVIAALTALGALVHQLKAHGAAL